MRHKASVLADHCAAIGRDPAEIEHSTATRGVDTGAADDLADAGFSLFTIGVSGPDYDLGAVPTWLAWRDAKNAHRSST
jgi:hypothetical protein